MKPQTRKRSLFLSSLLTISAFLCSCNNDEKQIKTLWSTYVDAITNNNGPLAATLIDNATIGYYAQMLSLVKTADSNTVAVLRNDQKFLVLAIRHIISRQQVYSFDGADLYSYCVQARFFESEMYKNNILQDIKVNQLEAKAAFVDTVTKAPVTVWFSKENDNWKINFTRFYASTGEDVWEWMIEKSGMTEDEFMYWALEQLNEKRPADNIWQPIL